MPICKLPNITRELVKERRDILFLYSFNWSRRGCERGQAAEMHGEPNALALPVKIEPNNSKLSFFIDSHLGIVSPKIKVIVNALRIHLQKGGHVVMSSHGLGISHKRFVRQGPAIAKLISDEISSLEKEYGVVETLPPLGETVPFESLGKQCST